MDVVVDVVAVVVEDVVEDMVVGVAEVGVAEVGEGLTVHGGDRGGDRGGRHQRGGHHQEAVIAKIVGTMVVQAARHVSTAASQ